MTEDAPIIENEDIFKDSYWLDADYQLTSQEVTSYDKTVYGVVRQRGFCNKIFPTVPIPRGVKTFTTAIELEQDPPIFDDNFNREDLDEFRKSESSFYPVFMHKDFILNMTDIDASNNARIYNGNLKTQTLKASTATIMDYKEKVYWRGYDISGRAVAATNNQGSIDTSSKGIMNTTNVQTYSGGAGADGSLTAAGDGPANVAFGMSDLIDYQYYGPYDMIVSPGTYKQAVVMMNSTTHITDLERMQSMVDLKGRKILRNLDVSKYLLNTAETTSTGCSLMFDRKTPAGEPTCVLGEEYPVAHYPISDSRLGTRGKVIWAGIPIVLRPYAFTYDASQDHD